MSPLQVKDLVRIKQRECMKWLTTVVRFMCSFHQQHACIVCVCVCVCVCGLFVTLCVVTERS
jgi:hypothetical protein